MVFNSMEDIIVAKSGRLICIFVASWHVITSPSAGCVVPFIGTVRLPELQPRRLS